jgi:hypothetical protein
MILFGAGRHTSVKEKKSSPARAFSPDPSWRPLYAVGSAAALLYVVMIIVPLVLVFTVPQPPASGGAAVLQYIASHTTVYVTELICFVGLSVPALLVFLALSVSLKELGKNLVVVGALFGIVSEILALALNSSPPSLNGELVYLSGQYATASTDAQRVALATAAEGFIASANAVSAAGILTALGILLLSVVMLKGAGTGAAILGIVTGAIGIVFEALRPLIGMAYAVYGLLLLAWFIVAGWKLLLMSRNISGQFIRS